MCSCVLRACYLPVLRLCAAAGCVRACSGVARAAPCAVGTRARLVVVYGGGAGGGRVRGACGVQYGSSHRTEHGPTTTKTRISMHALRRAKTHTGKRPGGVAHLDVNQGHGPPYGKRAWSTQTGSAHAASSFAPPGHVLSGEYRLWWYTRPPP